MKWTDQARHCAGAVSLSHQESDCRLGRKTQDRERVMTSVLLGTGARLSRQVRRVVTLGGRRVRRKIVTVLAIVAMLVQLTPWRSGIARAATDRWNGSANDSNWDTAGNWSGG